MITPPPRLAASDNAPLDWPPAGAIDSSDTYDRYAAMCDVFFGDVADDVQFYLLAARSHVPAGRTLLEIGTGSGRLTERLLADGHRVVGLDASPQPSGSAATTVSSSSPATFAICGSTHGFRSTSRASTRGLAGRSIACCSR
jgi:hypothetical protein